MSRTDWPRSRKYSATVIAVFGASLRIIGLSSPVDTMAIAERRFSPSVSSRNSRTSRPRSPTNAITTTSKSGSAREHPQQRRLADARSREHADSLARTERSEKVDHANAGSGFISRRSGALISTGNPFDVSSRRSRAPAPAAPRRVRSA
jgi:hypothetical protein